MNRLTKRLKVLVADDEVRWIRRNAELLERMGHDVTRSSSRRFALEHLAHSPYDLVITDGEMEEPHSGVRLAADVKRDHPATKVIYAAVYFHVDQRNFDGMVDKMSGTYNNDLRAEVARLFSDVMAT